MGSINRRMASNEEYNSYMEQFKPEFVPATDCLICWDSIEHCEWTQCTRCNIYLHKNCEATYRSNKGYCKCPHCQRIGTLGSPIYN